MRGLALGVVIVLISGCASWTEVKRKTLSTRDRPVDDPELVDMKLSGSGTVLPDSSVQFEITWTPRCRAEVLRDERVRIYERKSGKTRKRVVWVEGEEPVTAPVECSKKIRRKASERAAPVRLRTPWGEMLSSQVAGGIARFRPGWTESGLVGEAARARLARDWTLSDSAGKQSVAWEPAAADVDAMVAALGPERTGDGDIVVEDVSLVLGGAKPRLEISVMNKGRVAAKRLIVGTTSKVEGLDGVKLRIARLAAGAVEKVSADVEVAASGGTGAVDVRIRMAGEEVASYSGRVKLPAEATEPPPPPPPPPEDIVARILRPVRSGAKVKITIQAGKNRGVARGWKGQILAGKSMRPLAGGGFTVLRVDRTTSTAMVTLSFDTVARNLRVTLSPP